MKKELLKSMNELLENFGRRKINKIEDWQKIPFSNKKDLLKLKIPKNTLEVRGTSGSTGESLFIYFSDKAVEGFINRSRKFIKKMGLKKKDLGLILFSYGNFIVGSMTEKACNKEEIPLIPFGSTSTYKKELMIELIKKFKPTVWFSTPSYALKLLGEIKEKKYFPNKILVGGEKLLDSYLRLFKEYNIKLFNLYGLTECNPVGFSDGINPKKIKLIYDNIYSESIITKQGEELIVTDFTNTSTPIIRYRTNDIIKDVKRQGDIIKEFEIVSRNDDLIKLRGAFVSKIRLTEILSNFSLDFIVYFTIKDSSDFIEIVLPRILGNKILEIEKNLREVLGNNKMRIYFKDKLIIPKTNSNKPKYFLDLRN